MALPSNWDSSTISVDKNTMNAVAQSVLTSAKNINNDLSDIINALNGLPISWTGGSATLVEDFNTRWSDATTALYGTQGDPTTGILNVITSGLAQAAQNYGENEGLVTNMFNQFTSPGSGSTSQPSSKPVTDTVTDNVYHVTSVNETFEG
jgi:uncharacterized protein YukE